MLTELFTKDGAIDESLDTLFKSSSAPVLVKAPEPSLVDDVPSLEKQEHDSVEEDEEMGDNSDFSDEEMMEQKNKERKKRHKQELAAAREKLKEQEPRTLFVGNVPVELKEKHAMVSEFKRIFKKLGKIESIRFRSIAIAKPINKRAGVLSKQFHPARKSMNAYVVYKEPLTDEYKELNGTEFHGNRLRVDKVNSEENRDPRKCVFVGNLPVDAEENKLFEFFECCGDIEYVRIVRDKEMNIGKGIAYVQFVDEASVALALQMNGNKFEKRALRITKCLVKGKIAEEKAAEKKEKRDSKKRKAAAGDDQTTKKKLKKPRWSEERRLKARALRAAQEVKEGQKPVEAVVSVEKKKAKSVNMEKKATPKMQKEKPAKTADKPKKPVSDNAAIKKKSVKDLTINSEKKNVTGTKRASETQRETPAKRPIKSQKKKNN